MIDKYNFTEIEKKWQEKWKESNVFEMIEDESGLVVLHLHGRGHEPVADCDRFEVVEYRTCIIVQLVLGGEGGQTEVLMQARRAPGRFTALCGMVGIIICTAVWCWWRKEEPQA